MTKGAYYFSIIAWSERLKKAQELAENFVTEPSSFFFLFFRIHLLTSLALCIMHYALYFYAHYTFFVEDIIRDIKLVQHFCVKSYTNFNKHINETSFVLLFFIIY